MPDAGRTSPGVARARVAAQMTYLNNLSSEGERNGMVRMVRMVRMVAQKPEVLIRSARKTVRHAIRELYLQLWHEIETVIR